MSRGRLNHFIGGHVNINPGREGSQGRYVRAFDDNTVRSEFFCGACEISGYVGKRISWVQWKVMQTAYGIGP